MAGRKRQMRKLLPMSQQNEDLENLLVFGYECKLFRDDEKALHIDRGGHLIPWMGDVSLQIDRYDGRGYLYDLHEYDASRTAGQEPDMSEEERRIEDLCDEERYLELHTDRAEKASYEEEELKRLNAAFSDCYYDYGGYAAVGFNYNAEVEQDGADQNEDGRLETDEDEEAYEVPAELNLPEGIIPPMTVKIAKIMEKTAKFVSTQGAQMEIRIKMKQHDNPQFGFLDFHDELNPFYKHLVAMIKAGKYKPKLDRPPETKRQDSDGDGCHGDDDDLSGQPEGEYLHPSLMPAQRQTEPEINSKDFLESVKSKLPSGQMSNTLYAKLVSKLTASSGRSSPVTFGRTVVGKAEAALRSHGYKDEVPRPPPPPPILGATHAYVAQSEDPNSGYGLPMANLPPPPGMEPVTLPSSSPPPTQPPPPGTVPPEAVDSPVHSRSKRGHGAEDPTEEVIHDGDQIIFPPPPDVLPIIDKMAAYVAKNGPDFEMIVKTKTDERFQFLHEGHVHNLYYEYKKQMFEKEFATEKVKVTITQTSQNAVGHTVVTKTTTTLANVQPSKGVSFSIKAKESEGPSLSGRKMALLYDSSDDDDGEHKERREGETDGTDGRMAGSGGQESQGLEKPARPEKTQLSLEELERRQAEDRQKDRISNAAREKVAQASREKQLQAERKRRAALFINMLKGGPAKAPPTSGSQAASSTAAVSAGGKDDLKDTGSTEPPSSTTSMSPKMSPHTSRAQSPASVTLIRSRGNSSTRSRSPIRTRSPVRAKRESREKDRGYSIDSERSRDRDRERDHERSRDKWERQREKDFRRPSIRSRSPVWSRRRSRSPRRRKRSKTPPTAYSIVRRSRSRTPPKKKSRTRSRSPIKHKKKSSKKSRSPSREKQRNSPAKTRKRSRSRSKSRKSRSRSKSRKSRSQSKTRKSRSKSKEKKSKKRSKTSPRKSKSRSRSRSRKPKSRSGSQSRKAKSRSKSPSKPKKSKRKSRTPSPVKASKHSTELRDGDKLTQILEVKSDSEGEAGEADVIIQENSTTEPVQAVRQSPPRNHSGNGVEESSEAAPVSGLQSNSGSTYSATTPPSGGLTPPASVTSSGKAPVSQALLSKVRAMLKASRAQILKEEGV